MEEEMHRARLVDAAALGDRGVTATLSRTEVEEARRAEDGPARLVLDVARRAGDGDDVEAHTLTVEFSQEDLEELLRQSNDELTLAFDREELEHALGDDVEAHGLRERALVLTVAAATVGGLAGQAAAHPEFGTATPAAVTAAAPERISDASSGGGYEAPTPAASEVISDAASGGGYEAPTPAASELVSDAASGGGYEAPTPAASELVSDAASGGGYEAPTPAASEVISDAASGGGYEAPASAATASSTGGSSFDATDARNVAIGGGLALLITGAGFLIRGQRGRAPRPV